MPKRKPAARPKKKTASSSAPRAPRAAMGNVLALFGGGRQRNALDQAQELMYQAWEASTSARRLALARRALELSADCADAYLLISQEGATAAEAIALLREGVAAGERALGKRAFKDDVGHFWGLLETRPYMRVRAALAQLLWDQGQHDDAIAHYRDLLRLNPNDNQGLRYVLMDLLLERGLDDEAAELLGRYPDDCAAAWAYAAALLAYRRDGDNEKTRDVLAAAKQSNPHVPAYLLGKKKVPKRLPDYMGMGDESEAVVYASTGAEGWRRTAGALDWLRSR